MIATPRNMEVLMIKAGAPICAPGLIAYSERTGEEYSASPGDYYHMGPDSALLDNDDEPMLLGYLRVRFEEA